jgi:NADPH-dependent 2,4-dienoyl-CoA reductase/sulfur reductase-like enzyme
MEIDHCTVLIIGGGPAGLAAALELKKQAVGEIKVVEREAEAGGVPRLCHHIGFGWRDLRRWRSGPAYARTYREQVADAGIEVQSSTMVTGWAGPRTVTTTSPLGLQQIQAQAILLATGCRERPPAARLVPGNRPQGVFTTGSLQRFIHEYGQRIGRRAVVVGAELISLSAALTLAQARISVEAMVTEHSWHQINFPFLPVLWYMAGWLGVKIVPLTRLSRILGQKRVEAVECTHVEVGQVETLACDTVVFTGKWIPEHDLAHTGGLVIDAATQGPQVDTALRTSAEGVFAAGNLLRGAQPADYVALEGRRAAHNIVQFLRENCWPQSGISIQVAEPVAWIAPSRVAFDSSKPVSTPFLFQVNQFCRQVQAHIYQGNRLLHSQVFRRLAPNQSFALSSHWLAKVDRQGEGLRFQFG